MHKIKKKTVIPIYRQVLNHIQSDIQKGILKDGSKLPPEPELAELYGVSRVTIRKTLAQLVHEGLVERRKGKGTFIKDLEKQQLADTFCILSFSTDLVESNEYDFGILRGIIKELDPKSPLTTIYWRKTLISGNLKIILEEYSCSIQRTKIFLKLKTLLMKIFLWYSLAVRPKT